MRNRRNYYRILQLQPDAPSNVIKTNYRVLMQKLRMHPDLGGDDWNATVVNEAYATLKDPVKRATYDRALLREYDIATLSRGKLIPSRKRTQRGIPEPQKDGANRRNFYRVLQVQTSAPSAVIEASYKTLKKSASVPTVLLENAYATLINPQSRAAYDLTMRGNFKPAGMTSGASSQSRGELVRSVTPVDSFNITRGKTRSFDARAATIARSNPWARVATYTPVITLYCAFCKTPHKHMSGPSAEALCCECASPLSPPPRTPAEHAGRDLPRVHKDEAVGFYLYWPGRRCVGTVSDLSPSGMQLATNEVVSVGTDVKIDASRFQAVGRVIYVRRMDNRQVVGLEFITALFFNRTGSFFSSIA